MNKAKRSFLRAALFLSIAGLAANLIGLSQRAHADSPAPDPARFEQEIASIQERDAAAPPPQNGIVFIGSSNIRKWPLNQAFPELPAVNHGFGGSQASDAVFFFDRLITPLHPKLVVFHEGGNDLSAGRSPVQIVEDFKIFVTKLHAELPGTRMIYVGLIPAPVRVKLRDQYHETTRLIKAYVKTDRMVTFIDPEKALLSGENAIRPELYEPDNLHLNAMGYDILTKRVAPELRKAWRRSFP